MNVSFNCNKEVFNRYPARIDGNPGKRVIGITAKKFSAGGFENLSSGPRNRVEGSGFRVGGLRFRTPLEFVGRTLTVDH